MLLTTHLVCLKNSIFYYQTSDFTTTKLTFIASDTKIQTHVLKIVGCTLYICATNVTATLNVIGMKWESVYQGNYIEGYKLAPGKKVNNFPPPAPLTTSKPMFSSPCGGRMSQPKPQAPATGSRAT